jgi:hypothetical protein
MTISIGDIFKPGDTVPASGIYKVFHDSHHISDHEVTCVFARQFRRATTAENIRCSFWSRQHCTSLATSSLRSRRFSRAVIQNASLTRCRTQEPAR